MISSALRAFAAVFPAELPDKTMVATIVLVARFRRPVWVWAGAAAAFLLHVVVAVAAGSAIGMLPDPLVTGVVTLLFLVGAILLFREGRRAANEDLDAEREAGASIPATVMSSFGLIVVAEWGDLTQLATASLAASSHSPAGTAIGAWAALIAVAGIAATFGRQLVARVPLHRINFVGAFVFAALAVWSTIEFIGAVRGG